MKQTCVLPMCKSLNSTRYLNTDLKPQDHEEIKVKFIPPHSLCWTACIMRSKKTKASSYRNKNETKKKKKKETLLYGYTRVFDIRKRSTKRSWSTPFFCFVFFSGEKVYPTPLIHSPFLHFGRCEGVIKNKDNSLIISSKIIRFIPQSSHISLRVDPISEPRLDTILIHKGTVMTTSHAVA